MHVLITRVAIFLLFSTHTRIKKAPRHLWSLLRGRPKIVLGRQENSSKQDCRKVTTKTWLSCYEFGPRMFLVGKKVLRSKIAEKWRQKHVTPRISSKSSTFLTDKNMPLFFLRHVFVGQERDEPRSGAQCQPKCRRGRTHVISLASDFDTSPFIPYLRLRNS